MKERVRLGVVQGFGGIRRNKERRMFVAKENRRKKKVVMVVQVQRMVAPILLARGQHVRVWNLKHTSIPST